MIRKYSPKDKLEVIELFLHKQFCTITNQTPEFKNLTQQIKIFRFVANKR